MGSMNYILMADIIGSSDRAGADLMLNFKQLVNSTNKQHRKRLLSPLTITLGDEFQGIPASLEDAVRLIIALEEGIVHHNFKLKLRYVLYHGPIDTPINPDIAYGMLGDGLTKARYKLESLKKERKKRFHVIDPENTYLADVLNLALGNYQSIIDDWRHKDFDLVSNFLIHKDYKKVAEVQDKDNSSVFRRKDSLKISEYASSRALLLLLSAKASTVQAEDLPERDLLIREVAELS